MGSRWGVTEWRNRSVSRLEERQGWLGHERDGWFGADPSEAGSRVQRDDPTAEERAEMDRDQEKAA